MNEVENSVTDSMERVEKINKPSRLGYVAGTSILLLSAGMAIGASVSRQITKSKMDADQKVVQYREVLVERRYLNGLERMTDSPIVRKEIRDLIKVVELEAEREKIELKVAEMRQNYPAETNYVDTGNLKGDLLIGILGAGGGIIGSIIGLGGIMGTYAARSEKHNRLARLRASIGSETE